MDSITQIILGAAVGDACLGKKVGNRAMVWGAIAGTIPDLDVIANSFMSKIDALAFHRGISHSISFSIVGALLLGWVVHNMYESKFHKQIGLAAWVILVFSIGSLFVFVGECNWIRILIGSVIAIGGSYYIYKRFNRPDFSKPEASLKNWQWLFFWALLTHPLLDNFTAYGTQLFAPFSDYRVAFNNISVADPIYTVVFVIPLIIAAFIHKSKPLRKKLVWTGIILSSLYMCFTVFNKLRVDNVMRNTLEQEHIAYSRFMTSPSILNNILWSGVAETEDGFYQGQYSLFDKEKKFKLTKLPKNHHLIADASEDDKVINTLKWFSNNYYSIIVRKDGKLQINDMRYGTFRGEGSGENDFIFNFPIEKNADGTYELLDAQGGPPRNADMGEMAKALWMRIKGI